MPVLGEDLQKRNVLNELDRVYLIRRRVDGPHKSEEPIQ